MKIFFGALVGAIIAFAWSFVSWMVLPWHDVTFNKFTNQEFVSWVVKENAPKSGVYISPYHETDTPNLTPDEIKHNIETQKGAMVKGPFIFAQVNLKGMDPTNPWIYVCSFLTQFVGAGLISYVLLQLGDKGYGKRLLVTLLIGLTVGILGYVPGWTWFGAGYAYTLVGIADLVVTWFLAGLFLAAFVKPRGPRELMM
ncbi:MAG: hypothetical protein KDK63_05050 [Chlamydiia bacterium]|nr:hypothetical protein [Chlamydiia bacterium]MCB1115349.1 hypothetical protein [Chlamydiia bacterium]